MQTKNKSRALAVVLCLFLGGFGAHKFYLDRVGLGVVYVLLFWTFIPIFLSIIDLIVLLVQGEGGFNKKYNGV